MKHNSAGPWDRAKGEEGDKYCGRAVTESGGEWEPRTGGRGNNTPEQRTQSLGASRGDGLRPLHRTGLSEPLKAAGNSKLGGTADRSIRPKILG